MAPWTCFYPLTNIFFSISPEEYEKTFLDEIWGCVKYIGIPYDTVMSMPVATRKAWIMKHNSEQENEKSRGSNDGRSTVMGESLNSYAQLEQQNAH